MTRLKLFLLCACLSFASMAGLGFASALPFPDDECACKPTWHTIGGIWRIKCVGNCPGQAYVCKQVADGTGGFQCYCDGPTPYYQACNCEGHWIVIGGAPDTPDCLQKVACNVAGETCDDHDPPVDQGQIVCDCQ